MLSVAFPSLWLKVSQLRVWQEHKHGLKIKDTSDVEFSDEWFTLSYLSPLLSRYPFLNNNEETIERKAKFYKAI